MRRAPRNRRRHPGTKSPAGDAEAFAPCDVPRSNAARVPSAPPSRRAIFCSSDGGAHLVDQRRLYVGVGTEAHGDAARLQSFDVADAVAEVLVGHRIVDDARARSRDRVLLFFARCESRGSRRCVRRVRPARRAERSGVAPNSREGLLAFVRRFGDVNVQHAVALARELGRRANHRRRCGVQRVRRDAHVRIGITLHQLARPFRRDVDRFRETPAARTRRPSTSARRPSGCRYPRPRESPLRHARCRRH